jgi:hypothetical protein
MTSEEKQAVRLMTAKYEQYGVTFIDLLRRFGQAPSGQDFKETYKQINAELKEKYINVL